MNDRSLFFWNTGELKTIRLDVVADGGEIAESSVNRCLKNWYFEYVRASLLSLFLSLKVELDPLWYSKKNNNIFYICWTARQASACFLDQTHDRLWSVRLWLWLFPLQASIVQKTCLFSTPTEPPVTWRTETAPTAYRTATSTLNTVSFAVMCLTQSGCVSSLSLFASLWSS